MKLLRYYNNDRKEKMVYNYWFNFEVYTIERRNINEYSNPKCS
nr:MAG TPA: hypothetical protein [Caudoviricetes sp.]